MKKRYLFLSVILIVMIIGATIGGTMSYFTTYTDAKGGLPINLGYSTKTKEDFSNHVKHLTIVNDKDSQAVFVRAKAFSGKYPLTISGENWTPEIPANWLVSAEDQAVPEGEYPYYYYTVQLDTQPADAADTDDGSWVAKPLDVKIENFPLDEDGNDGDSFNVVIIYESTPVKYHANGDPYADWTTVLDKRVVEGGN